MTKRQGKNLNILRTKRAVKMKLKTFFIIFKGFSLARNRFGPNSGPLRRKNISYVIFNQFKQVLFYTSVEVFERSSNAYKKANKTIRKRSKIQQKNILRGRT